MVIDPKEKQIRNAKFRDRMIKEPTAAEAKMARILKSLGIWFVQQKGFYKGDFHCIVDFYIPKPAYLAIEIDGGYHNTPGQQRADERKEAYLASRKIKVLRLTNDEVFDETELVVAKIKVFTNPKEFKALISNQSKMF